MKKSAIKLLYDFQRKLSQDIRDAVKAGHRNILVVLPTGGGKSILASAIVEAALKKLSRILFLVHRRELIKQQSQHFTEFGFEHGFIAAKLGYDFDAQLIISGVQSLVTVLEKLIPPDVLIIDEAHHTPSETHSTVFKYCGRSIRIGFTATPERLDGKGLDDLYDVMVEGPTVAELIEMGFLCKYDYYIPEFPVDVSEEAIERVKGDFSQSLSEKILNQPKITGDVIENYKKHCMGEKGFIFASNVKHSKAVADAFNEAGIPAAHIDGTMSQDKRDKIDKAFRLGLIKILCNVNLATEGYDVKDASYLGILRLTKSITLLKQIWGRVMRISPGKTKAYIFDHANNALRGMGLPDTPIKWNLEGRAARKKQEDEESFSITQCKSCGKYFQSGTKVCPSCGYTLQAPPKKVVVDNRVSKMKKVEEAEFKRMLWLRQKAEERDCWSFQEFRALGTARRYKNPHRWAGTMMSIHKERIKKRSIINGFLEDDDIIQ